MEKQLSVAKLGFRNGTIVLTPTIAHEKRVCLVCLCTLFYIRHWIPIQCLELEFELNLDCALFSSPGKTPIVSAFLNCLMF
jgi:hypothetical protein